MRRLAALLVLPLLAVPLLPGPAGAGEPTPPGVTVVLVRSAVTPPEVLDEAAIEKIEEAEGTAARGHLPDGAGSLGLVDRVGYVEDFVAGPDGDFGPVRKTVKEGLLADVTAKRASGEDALAVSIVFTIARVVRPMASFQTTIGSRTVSIQLPEVMFRRFRKQVRVLPGGSNLLHVGSVVTEEGRHEQYYAIVTDGKAPAAESLAPVPREK